MTESASVRAHAAVPFMNPLAEADVDAAIGALTLPDAAAVVEWVAATAEDAGLEPEAFDLVMNVAASHAHGGFPAALGALAALARPGGGLVLFGEGYWTRPPSDDFLAALGGATADELPLGLDALVEAARAEGLEVL